MASVLNSTSVFGNLLQDQELLAQIRFVNVYSTCFATRTQPPRDHGLHSVNLVYGVSLTDAERKQVVLTASEYEDWGWFSLEALWDKLDLSYSLDVALLTMAQEAFSEARF
ncbi:hypothetical protein PN462_13535 [Spirulina sp. CS-785/01]|uniref:hypothetical protein n=1 Tax=Spirulina sp. CS-785/01 TaxID=3021716 RepID=UPI00232D1E3A|nr:hypothetical protein [Spirulina sp. CS-785/01]MDB9314128.1 hypothetical protein [Spirulina sp. CS-785/01]